MHVKTVFLNALDRENAEARDAYLETACGTDSALREHVNRLLDAHENATGFLDPEAFNADALDQPVSPDVLDTVIDRYKILEKLGEGGMAVVYRAEQMHPLQRQVAIKIIKLGMDTKEVIARFEAERQVLAIMDHPNIAKVLDAGVTEAGKPYFVMELVRGIAITKYCDENRLNTEARLRLFVQVCNAVHHAHQKGVIHRDLKPSNILVALRDNKPVPVVIDFGIAKATHQKFTDKTLFTLHTQLIGTPEYMSPEQAELTGMDIDTRTDIYSLGVVLYELLTGTSPFDTTILRRAALGEIQRIICEEEPLRPSTRISAMGSPGEEIAARRGTNVADLAKCLNRELEWIPLKAMRKDRERRYNSASEFSDDIGNYLSDRPLLAGPESTMYRFRKAVHKHRVPAIAISAVAAALIVGFVISTSLYVRMRLALNKVSQLEIQKEADGRFTSAQRYHAEGRYQDGLDELVTLRGLRSLGLKARLLRAQLQLEVGEFKPAEDELLQLTQAEPQIAGPAHYLLTQIFLTSDSAKAETHRQLAETMLPETPEAFYLRGMTAVSADDALTWLSQAVALDPKHYSARRARTFAYHSLRAYEPMAEDASLLIFLHPQDYMGYALRAIANREIGRFEAAQIDHAEAIALCSLEDELPRLHDQRRVTYMRSGDYEAALQEAKRMAELRGDEVGFAAIEAWLALKEYDKVEAEYKRAAGLSEGSVRYFKADLEKHVFDLLRRGQPVMLPRDIASRSPFYVIEQAAELYFRLTERAEPLPIPGGLWLEDWSPDGEAIVYGQFRAFSWLAGTLEGVTSETRSRSVEIMNIVSGKTDQIARSGHDLKWSPDGEYIAFKDLPYGETNIWLAPSAGGPARRLTPGSQPHWSVDSKHLFFTETGQSRTLCSKNIDLPDTSPVTVMEAQADRHYGNFSISPDESLIAFEESSHIVVLTFPEGKDVARWEIPWPLQSWGMQLQWHPDGRTVVLNSTSQYNQMGTCLFEVATAKVTHVLNVTRPWCRTLWSPDGSQLIIQPYSHEFAWRLDIDPTIPLTEALAPALTTEEFLRQRLEKWNQRIEADPQYADNYVSRAVVLLSTKDYVHAEQDLNRCATLINESDDPAITAITYWEGMYNAAGRVTEAQLWSTLKAQLAERFPEALTQPD